jgi:phosphoribosylformimino-5-aminoimidazole carboxamide ribotide isomerase
MILYPAIDLKNGQCVRLKQGDMNQATVFNDDPGAQGAAFEAQGFAALHVVDLDGAFAGKPVNAAAVDAGISRVIIGTAALRDPDFVKTAAKAFPGKVAVGIDARDGFVAVEGWAETSTLQAADLGKRFEDAGVSAIIYTNIARDGMLSGLDFEGTIALGHALTIPVIASGGLASLADIERLTQPDCAHLAGAITGRALYDGRLDPAQALALMKKAA